MGEPWSCDGTLEIIDSFIQQILTKFLPRAVFFYKLTDEDTSGGVTWLKLKPGSSRPSAALPPLGSWQAGPSAAGTHRNKHSGSVWMDAAYCTSF